MLIEANRQGDGINPTGMYVSMAGFVLGHKWKPVMGSVFQRQNRLRYQVMLTHEWLLMGVSLYTSLDEYAGTIPVKK